MAKTALPKVGERIPIQKFHVSELNVRAEQPFGDSEEDRALISQLRQGKVVQPFKARPERKGYGVVVGRRRFLAKKRLGAKELIVGVDCLIEEMTNEEARKYSFLENLETLRKTMNPMTRAEKLAQIIAFSPSGLRGTATELGLKPSTVSEWLKILQLTPKMRGLVTKELLTFSDALTLAKMDLGKEKQSELAELLEAEGSEAFKKELARLTAGKMKRGIPKGAYIILRTTFDKRYKPDVELYEKLSDLAKEKEMKVDEYSKWVLTEHVKSMA